MEGRPRKSHQELVGDAHTYFEKKDELSRERCPIRGYTPDLYLCKRSQSGRLLKETVVEAEVTLDDIWRPHTRGQLRKARAYCCESRNLRTGVLVVPKEVEQDAKRMLGIIRMKEIVVLAF